MGVGVGVPVLLIIMQPDKGTTMVLGITIVLMAYLAGVPKHIILGFLILGVLAFLALSLKDDYSRQRFLTMFDPWQDPFDTGYQLIQGFYAFGSGGLFGVGIGFSRQKYSYLPYAYNDFIFAVIGEECGLVGTLGMLAGFGVFAWAGLKIAQQRPGPRGAPHRRRVHLAYCGPDAPQRGGRDRHLPALGKPIPFISYGGTSILASLMIAGMIVSVSVHSRLPETEHDSARRSWRLEEDAPLAACGRRPLLRGRARPALRAGRGRQGVGTRRERRLHGGERSRPRACARRPPAARRRAAPEVPVVPRARARRRAGAPPPTPTAGGALTSVPARASA